MEEKQILQIITSFLNFAPNEINFNNMKSVLENEPLARVIVVKRLDNEAFRRIEKELGLPSEYAKERESYEQNIVNNYHEHSLECVQQALCDLLFHNNKQNVKLIIQTLEQRAEFDDDFRKIEEKYSNIFRKFLDFLELDPENVTNEQIESLLNELSVMYKQIKLDGQTLLNVANYLYKNAEEGFKSELQETMQKSKDKMFDGLEPTIIESKDGQNVKLYKMQNQGPNQSEFIVLTRTNAIKPYMMEEGAKEKYCEDAGKRKYYSYSVCDQTMNDGFSRYHRVTFGFYSLGESDIMSCTTKDGQTNQFTLTNSKKHVMRQELLPISEFLAKTGTYNEIVLTNPESIVPDFIYSYDETPSEDIIKIASAMGIPIVYVDESKYEKHKPDNDMYTDKDWYSYYNIFLKEQLSKLNNPESGG